MSDSPHVIIVGGGPAGLTAALYAGRSRLDTLLLERGLPGGQLLNTTDIEDYPGFRHIQGPELAQEMKAHAEDFGARLETARVTSVARTGSGRQEDRWAVETEGGDRWTAPTVVLAAGGAPNKLEVPGEEAFAGRGVSYCAVCDGAFFQDEVIAVVGGGDAACEEADFLTRYASKVYLIHRRNELSAQPVIQERVFDNPKIEVLWDRIVTAVRGDEQGVTHLETRSTRAEDGELDLDGVGPVEDLEVGGLFIFIGFVPNVELLTEHAEHDEGGHLITDDRMETSLPGLYAVGDVRSQVIRQITTAVADGTVAAFSIERTLTEAGLC